MKYRIKFLQRTPMFDKSKCIVERKTKWGFKKYNYNWEIQGEFKHVGDALEYINTRSDWSGDIAILRDREWDKN